MKYSRYIFRESCIICTGNYFATFRVYRNDIPEKLLKTYLNISAIYKKI